MREVFSTNLPLALTSFIGRERELAELTRLLTTTRLLTLTGVGGSGKTRLALQVATDLMDTYAAGVWLLELAPLTNPALIPQALAALWDVRAPPRTPLIDVLIDYLGTKHLLLVLDNCEHLVTACAQLAERLLRASPTLRVMATSREALGIPGEVTFRVPSLTLPDPQHLPPLETLATFEAIRLFVERATAARPDFRLIDANARSVAHVCGRLDAMPLAIELAAMRVKTLSVQQIAARLDDRFRLLTTGSRTAVPRQQTLVATVDWSYNLLSDEEQRLLRQLSVFAGGWTLEAAERVAGEEPARRAATKDGPPSTLDSLAALVDKSLVIAQEQEGDIRYHMLETIREYARERLAETGDVEAVRNRHLEYFQGWAEEVELRLRGEEQAVSLNRLEREHDNLRTALAWSWESDQVEAGLRLAAALTWFWYAHNHWSEGRRWLEESLTRGHDISEQTRAKALVNAAFLSTFQDDYARVMTYGQEGLELYRALDDKRGIAYALWTLGFALGDFGENAQADALIQESLTLRRQLGDKDEIAYSLHVLGEMATYAGDYDRALALLEESLALFREQGDRWAIALSFVCLAEVRFHRSEFTLAEAVLTQGLTLFQEAGDDRGTGLVLQLRGQVAQVRGDARAAYTLFRQALAAYYHVADKWALARCMEALIGLASAQGKFTQAVQWMGAVSALREAIHSPIAESDRAAYEQSLAAATAKLGPTEFDAAWQAGRTLTWEQAVESAMDEAATWALAAASPRQPGTEESQSLPELTITALGPARVRRGARELAASDWTYAKARQLFFYLLSHPPQSREQIGMALWPEASPAQLRGNLKVTLYHLRRALGRSDWILFENDEYAFNHALPYRFDVEAFESSLAEARRLQTQAPDRALARVEQAVELYEGDFLAGWEKGEWYLARQAELQGKYVEALLLMGGLRSAQAEYSRAADAYRRAIAQDSYLEVAHRELMRCLARQGEPGQALRHYLELVTLLRAELGAPPAPETRALYERLKRGEEI